MMFSRGIIESAVIPNPYYFEMQADADKLWFFLLQRDLSTNFKPGALLAAQSRDEVLEASYSTDDQSNERLNVQPTKIKMGV